MSTNFCSGINTWVTARQALGDSFLQIVDKRVPDCRDEPRRAGAIVRRHLERGDREVASFSFEAILNHPADGGFLAASRQTVMAYLASPVDPGAHAEVLHQNLVGHAQ